MQNTDESNQNKINGETYYAYGLENSIVEISITQNDM